MTNKENEIECNITMHNLENKNKVSIVIGSSKTLCIQKGRKGTGIKNIKASRKTSGGRYTPHKTETDVVELAI